MTEFYSHGKLLITSEYAVLDGAKALAIPTKFGQGLTFEKVSHSNFEWKSHDEQKQLWFQADFDTSKSELELISTNNKDLAKTLVEIFTAAQSLAESQIDLSGIKAATHLEFNRNWGLGTSSTLINNVSQWFQINAYELLDVTFGGSGYDIACAQHSNPIIYQLMDGKPIVKSVEIGWPFRDNLYFVYLNQKQNSRSGISNYRKRNSLTESHIKELNSITDQLLKASSLEVFEALIQEHNSIISYLLGEDPIAEILFKDFNGRIKNLGAWGGDFVLVSSREDPRSYFQSNGFNTILSYKEMIL